MLLHLRRQHAIGTVLRRHRDLERSVDLRQAVGVGGFELAEAAVFDQHLGIAHAAAVVDQLFELRDFEFAGMAHRHHRGHPRRRGIGLGLFDSRHQSAPVEHAGQRIGHRGAFGLGQPVGQREHRVHVVFDQAHGVPLFELEQQFHHALGLGLAHAGQRLVEQQHLRLGGQAHGDLQLPLAAVAERAGGALGHRRGAGRRIADLVQGG